MRELSAQLQPLWPLAAYFLAVLLLVLFILGVSHLLGERHRERATGEPFESGIVHIGDTHIRFSTPYFLMAILFVIFDLEAAFIYAYAISFRASGWTGYVEILVFILILLAALVYLWRLGGLDWGPKGQARKRLAPLQGHSRVLEGEAPPTRPNRE
ncbi:NADH-quinone oxidoreductase subunit A [Motiliproteus sp. SC1-56]|uniref:NADH-quinone oxidoreductase subunit A n=1 Tax=Motiliproteus sp. SC1-56 TaxID=2799565 RepID=UPI001A8C1D34|nr:NADH-quinone oxidoreductase subunit A [Motiliproteus sp. SC1-56]